ncbi:MAG: hypothetical protein ACFFHD_04315 [Promethearchaeota archaeon]
MTEYKSFNLEIIKELTNPIETLQVKVNQLRDILLIFESDKQYLVENFTLDDLTSQIQDLTKALRRIQNELEKISTNNIHKFLSFKQSLIKKHKETYQESLKILKLNQISLREIGLKLIENRKISKNVYQISIIPSIGVYQWSELLDSLKKNSIFLRILKNVESYYQKIIQDKLKLELSKIPPDTDSSLIRTYQKAFHEDPSLSFNEFIQNIEKSIQNIELKAKKEIIQKAKDAKDLEKLKKKQEEQNETYEDYLKLSEKEFERKLRRKSREKLKKKATSAEESENLELSDEISEKIQKFKSQFDKKFEEKYLIQNDEQKDPIKVIRERKRKKEKEFKTYKKHFKE